MPKATKKEKVRVVILDVNVFCSGLTLTDCEIYRNLCIFDTDMLPANQQSPVKFFL